MALLHPLSLPLAPCRSDSDGCGSSGGTKNRLETTVGVAPPVDLINTFVGDFRIQELLKNSAVLQPVFGLTSAPRVLDLAMAFS